VTHDPFFALNAMKPPARQLFVLGWFRLRRFRLEPCERENVTVVLEVRRRLEERAGELSAEIVKVEVHRPVDASP
jgi:hypothetical protein